MARIIFDFSKSGVERCIFEDGQKAIAIPFYDLKLRVAGIALEEAHFVNWGDKSFMVSNLVMGDKLSKSIEIMKAEGVIAPNGQIITEQSQTRKDAAFEDLGRTLAEGV